MNIILYCRILSVDFPLIFRREGKEGREETGKGQSGHRAQGPVRAQGTGSTYVDSLFREEEVAKPSAD